MDAALVKIDVAAADLDLSVAQVFDLVDGGTLLEHGLTWVFDLSQRGADGRRRDLRFWRPELLAYCAQETVAKYADWKLEQVLVRILPEKRTHFHAGEVDKLLQLRPRTRIDLHRELAGSLQSGRHLYHRHDLAAFLRRRWLSACPLSPVKAAPQHSSVSSLPVSRVGQSPSTGAPAKPL